MTDAPETRLRKGEHILTPAMLQPYADQLEAHLAARQADRIKAIEEAMRVGVDEYVASVNRAERDRTRPYEDGAQF